MNLTEALSFNVDMYTEKLYREDYDSMTDVEIDCDDGYTYVYHLRNGRLVSVLAYETIDADIDDQQGAIYGVMPLDACFTPKK